MCLEFKNTTLLPAKFCISLLPYIKNQYQVKNGPSYKYNYLSFYPQFFITNANNGRRGIEPILKK